MKASPKIWNDNTECIEAKRFLFKNEKKTKNMVLVCCGIIPVLRRAGLGRRKGFTSRPRSPCVFQNSLSDVIKDIDLQGLGPDPVPAGCVVRQDQEVVALPWVDDHCVHDGRYYVIAGGTERERERERVCVSEDSVRGGGRERERERERESVCVCRKIACGEGEEKERERERERVCVCRKIACGEGEEKERERERERESVCVGR